MEKSNNRAKSNKPLYACQRGNTTISVLPTGLRYGTVAIRLQRKENEQIKKLQCKVKISRVSAIDYSAPAGTVIAEAVDIIPPETCAKIGYRDDNKGYARALSVTILDDAHVQVTIICTLCSRDDQGHICSTGKYKHIEQIVLTVGDVKEMVKIIQLVHDEKLTNEERIKNKKQYRGSKNADVAYDG